MTAITIRRAVPGDAAAFARIMGDPLVYPALLQMPHPSEEGWRSRLAEFGAPGKSDFMIVAERDGEVVGNAGLHPAGIQIRRRHVGAIGICVAADAQGKGVGKALMQALCDYADGWMNLLRIELIVFADNAPAIALYRKFGFRIEGRHLGYAMRDGRYADALSMARLHPRPPSIEPGAVDDVA
ncbi:MAG TPA: GNAT family N-acetyltransferase [Caldimonas sp.]|nr:GNAT family N-acetyltransferase [Caldimonas sp.]